MRFDPLYRRQRIFRHLAHLAAQGPYRMGITAEELLSELEAYLGYKVPEQADETLEICRAYLNQFGG